MTECDKIHQPAHDFQGYMLAQERVERARERANYADAALQNAQIRCRLAEIKSQHEPLNQINIVGPDLREQLYAAAYYVVVGRLPENFPKYKKEKA